MRTFIAINIPEGSKNLIQNKVELIKKKVNQDIKWVKKDNWHLTLKFLGDIDKSKISNLKKRISPLKNDLSKFPIQFKGISAFPELNYPKVFFLKIIKGNDRLINIQKKIDDQLQKEGFKPEDRDYIPHLTIARSRKNTDMKQLSQKYKKFTKEEFFINVYMKAKNVSLMKSKLYPEGPKYKKIFDISLK